MSPVQQIRDLKNLKKKAVDASNFLSVFANDKRLIVL